MKIRSGIIIMSVFIIFAFARSSQAANIYVDQTLNSDIINGTYSKVNRNNSGSDGNAYRAIQAAINAMSGGDHIYLRGGTYNAKVTIPFTTKNGTSNNYSSMESYPGEWAIIDGAGTTGPYLIGNQVYDADGTNSTRYWRFERFEVRNYATHGFMFAVGPFIFRYLYIHSGSSLGNQGDNPAGIYCNVMQNSIIKYCLFDDNGGPVVGELHNTDILPLSDYYSTHSDFNRETNYWNPNYHASNNEIAYNYFPNTTGRSIKAYSTKAQQFLAAKTVVDFANRGNLGDKFHHNIVLNYDTAVRGEQDFLQVYNNIFEGGVWATLTIPGYTTAMTGVTVYNNTIINGRTSIEWGYPGVSGVPTPYWFVFNNLFDGPFSGEATDQYSINVTASNPNTVEDSRINIDRNYFYRANTNYDFEYWEQGAKTDLTCLTYNSTYSKTNYKKASSEGLDNIFQSSSGASQYITRGGHSVVNGKTIVNGGIGGAHPYLSGVQIPLYIGATNPNDNAWVAGVLGLATLSNLQNAPSGDPAWIEGKGSSNPYDLNGDGIVNVQDVTICVNMVLAGTKNIADLMAVVNEALK